MITVEWETGDVTTRWTPDELFLEWDVGVSIIGINHLSTEFILVPVVATKSGAAYNPTVDVVQFAFMPTPTQVPTNTDWVVGSWDTVASNSLYPYSAKCLIGPSGIITLAIGSYVIYLKITDSPEVPVLIAGQLQVS